MEDIVWLILAVALGVFALWIGRRPRRGASPADSVALKAGGDGGSGGDPGGTAGSV
jgi:hypothetical protein